MNLFSVFFVIYFSWAILRWNVRMCPYGPFQVESVSSFFLFWALIVFFGISFKNFGENER